MGQKQNLLKTHSWFMFQYRRQNKCYLEVENVFGVVVFLRIYFFA